MDEDGFAVKCEESLNEMIINRVKSCQALWNIKHKKFRDTVYKKVLWARIGQQLGVNGEYENFELNLRKFFTLKL